MLNADERNPSYWHSICFLASPGETFREEDMGMTSHCKHFGSAKRIRVRLPFGAVRSAWDCRPFGFGRIIAPITAGAIEIAPGIQLDLGSGLLTSEAGGHRHSA